MSDPSSNGTSRARQILLPGPGAALRGSTDVIRGSLTRTSGLLRRLARSHVPDPRVAAETDEVARFRAAQAVAGRTEADMPEVVRGLGVRFELFAVLAILSVVWIFVGSALGLGGQTGHRLIDLLFPVGFCAWTCAEAFGAAVSLHRAQLRRMVTVREFLRTPAAWWGGPPSRGASLCLAALAAGLGLSALVPYEALAQGMAGAAAAGTVTAGSVMAAVMTNGGMEDLSLEWLRRIFPGMAHLACGSGGNCPNVNADLMAAMMGTFNAALFGIGSFMMAFQTLVGTVQTAHEGKVMGQKWHTIWAPIRVLGGVAMLVPIKGYCGMQYVMLMLIVLGYNLANGLWVSYVQTAFSGSMAAGAVTASQSAGLGLANGVLANETCAAVLRAHVAGLQAAAGGTSSLVQGAPRRGSIGGLSAQSAAANNGGGIPPFGPNMASLAVPSPAAAGAVDASGARSWDWGTTCGRIVVAAPSDPLVAWNPSAQAAGQTAGGRAQQRSITEQAVERGIAAYRAFLSARDAALTALVREVQDANVHGYVVATVVPNVSPDGVTGAGVVSADVAAAEVTQRYERVVRAGEAFDAAYNAAARTMVQAVNAQGSQQFVQRATALGWASAGAMNATLMRAAARAAELNGGAIPSLRGPDPSQLVSLTGGTAPDEMRQRLAAGLEAARRVAGNLAPGGTENALVPQVQVGADMQSRNLFAQVFKPLSDSVTRYLTDDIGYINPLRPMSSIQSMGNNMLLAGQGMALAWINLNMSSEGAATSAAGLVGAGVARGAVTAIGVLYVPVMIGLLICGALHAYILPMIAFLIWFYAIIAVVSVAAELVIAAPVAAFMHVRADGDELINDRQRTIYVMAFNALLRPSLLLFGLATANLVFSAMCNFLNATYGMAVSTTNGDSVVGVVGWMTMTVMVFYLHYQLVLRSMHLITAVPSTVAELIGARDQSRDEQENTRQVFGAVANISTRAGANLQQGIGAMARGNREEGRKTAEGADAGGGGGTVRSASVAPAKPDVSTGKGGEK